MHASVTSGLPRGFRVRTSCSLSVLGEEVVFVCGVRRRCCPVGAEGMDLR